MLHRILAHVFHSHDTQDGVIETLIAESTTNTGLVGSIHRIWKTDWNSEYVHKNIRQNFSIISELFHLVTVTFRAQIMHVVHADSAPNAWNSECGVILKKLIKNNTIFDSCADPDNFVIGEKGYHFNIQKLCI